MSFAEDVYRTRHRELLNELRSKGDYIIIFIDACYNSSRNVAHGTIAVINEQTGKVIQIIIKAQEKHRDSRKMEDPAIHEAIQNLRDAGIYISEAVHDDKSSVDQILQEYGIISQKDLWHKCKSLTRKFKKQQYNY